MLVDSHCHLNFPQFTDGQSIKDVVARASDAGVTTLQTICTQMQEFPAILSIAEAFSQVYASVGVHPNHVDEAPLVTLEELINASTHPKVIGLGETGLDYHYSQDPSVLAKQHESFLTHIEASRQTGLPVIIHTRDADDDTISLLKSEMKKGQFTGLIHCFSTGRKLAEAAIELGLYVSISGIVTFKSARDLQNTVQTLPLSSLLVETDAPYLAPAPHRGKTNEPAYTRHTAEFLATLKNVTFDEVARTTTANFFELFSKAKPNSTH
jgi:TatD DNase family protein